MHPFLPLAKGVVGAVAGSALGYLAFSYLLAMGFYALILPGFLAGLGANLLCRTRSLPLGVFTGLLGFAVGVLAEWKHAPFLADESLGFFLLHLHQLRVLTWIMLAVGTLAAFWYGRGSNSAYARAPALQD